MDAPPATSGECSDQPPPPASSSSVAAAPADDRVYLVPFRWWKEAQESEPEVDGDRGIPYAATPAASSSYGMKLINNIFSSDLVFNLRKDDDSKWSDAEAAASGRSYALIPADMWSRALKWHNDAFWTMKNNWNSSFSEDGTVDVYPLMLKISVMRETNILTVKICKKENVAENYKKANKIFSADSEPVRIWDFSGHSNLILMNEWNRWPQDCQRQSDQEILLEIQVYALSESSTCRSEGKKDDLASKQSKICSTSCGGSLVSNGSIGNMDSYFYSSGSVNGVGSGLRGLENLGNTCFMNSAIQCLAHTPKLVDYFLGDYGQEINQQNPLGMSGELALAFGDLLRKLWAFDRTPVVPRGFKAKLAHFAPQFSGFNQHDSQELLAFLLDGLHEDLNRVKCKPYFEAKDACGRPDEEVADEYWGNHLARNDSIIVDICQGQYKSTLVCPVCNKVSITFDPFMYLSLPLPSTTMRTMTVTVFSTKGSSRPTEYTINVAKSGKCRDLVQALGIACSLREDESLLVAEIYASRIIRYLADPSDSLSLIRDGDRLAAYRLPKELENAQLVVFTHQCMEEHYLLGRMTRWKAFGVPLIAKLPDTVNGSNIRNLYLKLLSPFYCSKANDVDEDQENCRSSSTNEVLREDASFDSSDYDGIADVGEVGNHNEDEFELYLTDEKSQTMQSKIEIKEPVLLTDVQKQLHVLVCWRDKAKEQYNLSPLNSLPEIYKSGFFLKRPQDSCTLYACLEAFLKEEPLGPEDMWYCPGCKKHQQASKKLDLWRLPEVLVIHLKRFSYNRFTKNKLETFVDFPIHDLDLSTYIANRTNQQCNHYCLYAVSNHYGNMGGGHYTAYVYHEGENRWYDFDDRHVVPVSEDSIKTSAAYVLFYRRIESNCGVSPSL